MRLFYFMALVSVAALGGCAHDDLEPTPAELRARWDAQNVFPASYKSDLLAYMRTYLNDPTHVRGAAASAPFLKSVGAGERYIVCVRYNARNTDGKYLGEKTGAAIYVAAKLDRYIDTPPTVADLCKQVALAPFPELEKLSR